MSDLAARGTPGIVGREAGACLLLGEEFDVGRELGVELVLDQVTVSQVAPEALDAGERGHGMPPLGSR